jgi:hypothetical protein
MAFSELHFVSWLRSSKILLASDHRAPPTYRGYWSYRHTASEFAQRPTANGHASSTAGR